MQLPYGWQKRYCVPWGQVCIDVSKDMIFRKISDGFPADFELSLEFASAFEIMEKRASAYLLLARPAQANQRCCSIS